MSVVSISTAYFYQQEVSQWGPQPHQAKLLLPQTASRWCPLGCGTVWRGRRAAAGWRGKPCSWQTRRNKEQSSPRSCWPLPPGRRPQRTRAGREDRSDIITINSSYLHLIGPENLMILTIPKLRKLIRFVFCHNDMFSHNTSGQRPCPADDGIVKHWCWQTKSHSSPSQKHTSTHTHKHKRTPQLSVAIVVQRSANNSSLPPPRLSLLKNLQLEEEETSQI